MTFHEVFFWVTAIAAVGSAAMVLLAPSIVHMAFWLLSSLAGFAGLYLHLGADFVGMVQILVYIGGILILFLFGVMLTNQSDVAIRGETTWRFLLPGSIAGLAFLSLLVYLVSKTPWATHEVPAAQPAAAGIGERFMSTFILPFEAVSILLLVAMIGATYIARSRDESPEAGEGGGAQ